MSLTRQSIRCCRRPSTRPSLQLVGTRSFTSTITQRHAATAVTDEAPRWSHTPERMKAPFSINQPKEYSRTIWKVNEDPKRLDAMYERLLGRDVTAKLPEELKWLAVTHKSFDNGRRGFNTRLAFYGRQILALEATRSIMASPASNAKKTPDPYGREPFQHPALANADKLITRQPQDLISKEKLARLAMDVGLQDVLRWKPRLPDNLEGAGLTVVLTSTMFAIIGAISLQQGAEAASRVVRDRILKRLGA